MILWLAYLIGLIFLAILDEIKNKSPWPATIWFILITFFSHILLVSALSGSEGSDLFAMIRFLPHIILLGPVLIGLFLARLTKKAFVSTAVFIFFCGLNLGNLRYWVNSPGRPQMPLSWWPTVYKNIFIEPDDPWNPVVKALLELKLTSVKDQGKKIQDDIISVFPAFASDILRGVPSSQISYTQVPSPSPLQQIAGLGVAGLGAYGAATGGLGGITSLLGF